MSRIVMDASAMLALLNEETGQDVVLAHLPNALICAVNMAEIYSKAEEKKIGLEASRRILRAFPLTIVNFDDDLAFIAGSLREPTRAAGLSLGDRACLALGMARQLPVLAAERDWEGLDLGVEIVQIR